MTQDGQTLLQHYNTTTATTIKLDRSQEAIEPNNICSVCFENFPSQDLHTMLCGSRDCEGAICLDCLRGHLAAHQSEQRWTVKPVPCPGRGCGRVLREKVWTSLVDEGAEKAYRVKVASLVTVRCPGCDQMTSQLRETLKTREELLERTTKVLEAAELAAGKERAAELRELCHRFSHHEASAGDVADEMTRIFGPVQMPPRNDEIFEDVFALVEADERRAALQLAFWKRHPTITNMCCSFSMCFRCQVAEVHQSEEDCRNFQTDNYAHDDVKTCPTCSVAIMRTEGCDSMTCVCGENFCWVCAPDKCRCHDHY